MKTIEKALRNYDITEENRSLILEQFGNYSCLEVSEMSYTLISEIAYGSYCYIIQDGETLLPFTGNTITPFLESIIVEPDITSSTRKMANIFIYKPKASLQTFNVRFDEIATKFEYFNIFKVVDGILTPVDAPEKLNHIDEMLCISKQSLPLENDGNKQSYLMLRYIP